MLRTGIFVLAVLAFAAPAAEASSFSLTPSGTGQHTYVYSWTVSVSPAAPSVQFDSGATKDLSFTVTASRAKTDDGYGVTMSGCVQNTTATDANAVSMMLQLQSAPSPSGPFVDVDGASLDFSIGTLAPGAEQCRDAFFGVSPEQAYRTSESVTSTDAGSDSAVSDMIPLPSGATGSYDATASLAAPVLECPVEFTCGGPSISFPQMFPSSPTSADPYSENVTYTRSVTAPACGTSSGTLRDHQTLTELDSSAERASAAEVFLTCAPPPPPPPPPPPGPPPPPPEPPPVRCVVPNVRGKLLTRARQAIARAHCRVGRVTRVHSAKRLRGKVVGQSPRPGANRPGGAKVNLRVGAAR